MTFALLILWLCGLPLVWRLLRINFVPTRTAALFTALWPLALAVALVLGLFGAFDDGPEEEGDFR